MMTHSKTVLALMVAGLGLSVCPPAPGSVLWVSEADTGSALETTAPYRYAFDTIPTLSAVDLGQTATITQVLGAKHPASGTTSVLKNGAGASSNNAPGENYFSDAGQAPNGARLLIDLGLAYPIKEFNSYSWHTGPRTPQVYSLYGANALGSPATPGAPGLAGYTLIASVDTRPISGFPNGQLGVSVYNNVPNTGIGNYRYLLLDLDTNVGGDGGTFFSELDIVQLPEPSTALLLGLGGLITWRYARRRK